MSTHDILSSRAETWKVISEFIPIYEISNNGRIRKRTWSGGYEYLKISSGGDYQTVQIEKQQMLVHRLVAQTFIDNPNQLTVVNHIDGNKHHNWVENLEWCSVSQNIQHKFTRGLTDTKLVQCLTDGKVFGCCTSCAFYYGLPTEAIRHSASNSNQRVFGLQFKFVTYKEIDVGQKVYYMSTRNMIEFSKDLQNIHDLRDKFSVTIKE